MKRVSLFLLLICNLVSFCFCGSKDVEFERAMVNGASVYIRLRVIDDDGETVDDAKVNVLLGMNFRDRANHVSGVTSADGEFVIKGTTTGNEIEVRVSKDGYYPSTDTVCLITRKGNEKVKDGKWQPWGECKEMQLRKIANPKPIRHYCGYKDVPQTNVWVGLDMERGDWTSPYGKGLVADLELIVQWDCLRKPLSRNCFMQVRIKGVGCGGAFVDRVPESEFPYPQAAKTNDEYEVRSFFWKERENGVLMREKSFWNQRNFVIRSRCVVDESGRIKEANFGCIRELEVGPGDEGHPILGLHCVYNQEVNDLNLEDMDIAQRIYKQIELDKRLEKERREKEAETVWGGIKKLFGSP